MDKIFEILRRFSIAFIWIVGVLISVALVISGFNSNENLVIIFGVICFVLTNLIAKLVNWIFGD